METQNKIKELIYQTIDEINSELPKSRHLKKDEKTQLYGSQSPLDSLELVNFIVSLEDKIELEFEKSVTIANEKAMSLKNSPFRDVTSLTDFINELLTED